MKLVVRFLIGCLGLGFIQCVSIREEPREAEKFENNNAQVFPSFITPIDSYYEYSIDKAPILTESSYELKVTGLVNKPRNFTLSRLNQFKMYDRVQTIECIGNPANGELIGTARWKGFKIQDLLDSVEISDKARTVKYKCADGYFTSNTIEEIKEMSVLGALYVNQQPLPVKMGFPLRILNRGYYGVKNPGWVTEIEVSDKEKKDYWTGSSWEIEKTMEVDSKIFFPSENSVWKLNDTLKIGGAAYGGNKITIVEVSIDNGLTWNNANIIRRGEEENVWCFWEFQVILKSKGNFIIRSRAKDITGITQPLGDKNGLDGTNSAPDRKISVN